LSHIGDTFSLMEREGKKGFIPFIMAGDPDLHTTVELLVELASAGASLIELGVPFSDPMADGPVIQRASERALRNDVGLAEVLETAAQARKRIDVPLVLFSYFNPLLQYGIERLGHDAHQAGIDGVLVTDLTPEEATDFSAVLRSYELDMIFLAAPTSSNERLQMIAERASGFIYAVSRAGVTGAREEVSSTARTLVDRLRNVSSLPIAVGFGISTAAQVEQTWSYADAAVVGSAIVSEIERLAGAPDLVEQIGAFARGLLPINQT
jgi:tryptophan synthase alpha chain